MGGAGFPTHIKLSPPPGKTIETLIINGAECEPFITSDHRAMVEFPREILEGIRILHHILKPAAIRIAVKEGKDDVIAALMEGERQGMPPAASSCHRSEDLCYLNTAISLLPTVYPCGSEKQQIFAITGKEVPSSGLPSDVGCLVENVNTVIAIYNAVVKGWPLDERIVTVTGPAIPSPKNIISRIGTAYRALIAAAGGLPEQTAKVIAGGAMMGFAQYTLDVVTTKTVSGVLALRAEDCTAYSSLACISCGRCNAVCPMRILPSELSQLIEADAIEAAEKINLMDCFECGACSYVCPARRPLVQHFRRAKGAVALRHRLKVAEASPPPSKNT